MRSLSIRFRSPRNAVAAVFAVVFPVMFAVATPAAAQVILDRVAIVVGQRVVKTSDIDRDLRASEFLNRQPLDLSDAAKRKVADRVIEQRLIRQEMERGNWARPGTSDIDRFVTQIRDQRFHGSDAEFGNALAQYGLTMDQFRRYAEWQLTVLRFIDERFRPGVLVTDEDVRAWYDQHRSELGPGTLEQLTPKIREQLTGERVNQAFEEWLKQTRARTRVQFRPAAFGGEAPSGAGDVEP